MDCLRFKESKTTFIVAALVPIVILVMLLFVFDLHPIIKYHSNLPNTSKLFTVFVYWPSLWFYIVFASFLLVIPVGILAFLFHYFIWLWKIAKAISFKILIFYHIKTILASTISILLLYFYVQSKDFIFGFLNLKEPKSWYIWFGISFAFALFSFAAEQGSQPGQSVSTVITKYCSRCGKTVSSSYKKGDSCPYCGAYWNHEKNQ